MKKNKKLISQKIPRIGLLQEAKIISIERKFCFNSKYSEKIVKYRKCKKKKFKITAQKLTFGKQIFKIKLY